MGQPDTKKARLKRKEDGKKQGDQSRLRRRKEKRARWFPLDDGGRRAFYTRSGKEGRRPKRRVGGRGVKEAFGWRIGKQEFGE